MHKREALQVKVYHQHWNRTSNYPIYYWLLYYEITLYSITFIIFKHNTSEIV